MRFKEFLSELEELDRPFTIKMPEDAAFEWIKAHSYKYAKGLSHSSAIWRGMNPKDGGAQWGDTSRFKRSSANTHNYYTLLIDSSKKWEHFPKRSRSFICSTGEHSSASYGKLFYVFPEDNAEIGVCPSNDIWDSFRSKLDELELRSLNHLNKFVDRLGTAMGDVGSPSEENAEELRADLRKMTVEKIEKVRNNPNDFPLGAVDSGAAISITKFMNVHHLGNMEEVMEFILDPEETGFDVIYASQFHDHNEYGKEMWFSGKAVFIPYAMLVNNDSEFYKLFTAEFGKLRS